MIKCKEDLINTYIENDHGELRDLYLKTCSKFGLHTYCKGNESFGVEFYGCKYIRCDKFSLKDSENLLQNVTDDGIGKYGETKLTLSDLKSRTRTEYEKVTESIFDLRDEFERVELYCKHEHAREYTQIINTQTLAQALHGGFCFRKVEKEIDERQEFIERAKGLIDASKDADYSLGNMYDAGCRFVGAGGELD